MAKGLAAGNEFFTGVLAKLSPEDRAKGEAALATLQGLNGGAVVAAVGDGTLAQAEFSRQSDELKTQKQQLDARAAEVEERDKQLGTWHGELTDWFTERKDLVALGRAAQTEGFVPKGGTPRGNGNGNGNPKNDNGAPSGLTEEQLNERIRHEQAAYLGLTRDQNLITRDHFKMFGEIVDMDPLLAHPQIGQIGLIGVYKLVHKDRLEQHTAAATKAHDDKLREEGAAAERARQAQMPYPSPTGVGSGSPLDALQTNKSDALVDAATAHYNRLQAERGSTASH